MKIAIVTGTRPQLIQDAKCQMIAKTILDLEKIIIFLIHPNTTNKIKQFKKLIYRKIAPKPFMKITKSEEN